MQVIALRALIEKEEVVMRKEIANQALDYNATLRKEKDEERAK